MDQVAAGDDRSTCDGSGGASQQTDHNEGDQDLLLLVDQVHGSRLPPALIVDCVGAQAGGFSVFVKKPTAGEAVGFFVTG
jgi:hypothetical protein